MSIYSFEQYPGDGVTDTFNVPFEYLMKDHIVVSVDGEPVPYTWVNDFTVRPETVPPAGAVVEVRRITPVDERVTDFQDGSTLEERDLDKQTSQLLYIVQEAYDTMTGTIRQASDGTMDARGLPISNVGEPTEDDHAATKGYVDTGVLVHVQAAQVARQGAEAARDQTQTLNTDITAETSRIAAEAETSRIAAEVALAQTLAAYDQFDDRYLGVKSVDPTTDNDGNPLFPGALYFQQTAPNVVGIMKVYTGAAWVAAYVNGDSVLTTANLLATMQAFSTSQQTAARSALQAARASDVTAIRSTVDQLTGLQDFAQFALANPVNLTGSWQNIDPQFGVVFTGNSGIAFAPGGNNGIALPAGYWLADLQWYCRGIAFTSNYIVGAQITFNGAPVAVGVADGFGNSDVTGHIGGLISTTAAGIVRVSAYSTPITGSNALVAGAAFTSLSLRRVR